MNLILFDSVYQNRWNRYNQPMSKIKQTHAMITVRKICLYILLLGIFLHSFTGCGAEKEVNERRNYMMPKTSELPRNSLYKESSKKKTHKVQSQKEKKDQKAVLVLPLSIIVKKNHAISSAE